MTGPLRIVVLGLSITSAWGNGHATTWRSLVKGLARLGHEVLFLERDQPWYAANRDLPDPSFCEVVVHDGLDALRTRHAGAVAQADLVIIGSYLPDGVEVAAWLLASRQGPIAFYDIDTPVTLAALDEGRCAYLAREQIAAFDLYFSFTGGPTLAKLERDYGARRARALFCSVDPGSHGPDDGPVSIDLGYLGTYSDDRQAALRALLVEPARRLPDRRFSVAGPQYPEDIDWPANVERVEHLPPDRHRRFYNAQRFTLNVTRRDMVRAGHAPSVRLFEAAACGTPIISDRWPGLDALFEPRKEILIVDGTDEVIRILATMPDAERRAIGSAARRRVLRSHTGERRAGELVDAVAPLLR